MLNDFTLDEFDIGKNRYLIPAFGLLLGIGIFFTIKIKTALDNTTSIVNVISTVFVLVAIVNVSLVATEISSCDKCAIQDYFMKELIFHLI